MRRSFLMLGLVVATTGAMADASYPPTQVPPLSGILGVAADAQLPFYPQAYGAFGDGNLHSVQASLGLTTLGALANYTNVAGVKPYAFVTSYPFGTLFNLPVAQAAASGSTTLTFSTSQATSAAVANGAYVLTLTDVAGVQQGQAVSGTGIAAGTQVDFVNPTTAQIRLSKATTGAVASGASLSFSHPYLSNVTVGMAVSGVTVPAGDTVTAVNVSAGTVTLAAGLSSAATTNTLTTASAPAYRSEQITFYAPYTDAQAAALQMDSLGINAAIQAAPKGVKVTLKGQYKTDMAIVIPLASAVSLEGQSKDATTIAPIRDFGPGQYAISCGDPTATAVNARGIYANGGTTCEGAWSSFGVLAPSTSAVGFRPTISGTPIVMDGILQGPRRNINYVKVNGFNRGIQFQGDWTKWTYVTASANFVGFRLADPMTSLYADLNFENTFFGGNTFAGVTIAPQAILSGHWSKSWLADEPYEIYFEAGAPYSPSAISQLEMHQINFEGAACGSFYDGNTTTDNASAGQRRGVFTLNISTPQIFTVNPFYKLPEGCQFNAFFDMYSTSGLTVRDIDGDNFAPISGGTSLIRVHTARPNSDGSGGIFLSGGGIPTIISNYAAVGQQMVAGPAGSSDFLNNNSSHYVNFEAPGIFKAREVYFTDPVASAPALGSLLESRAYFTLLAAQLGGRATAGTATLLGTALGNYGSNSMAAKFVVVGVSGTELPVLVSAAANVATLLKVGSTPGIAVAASSVTDGQSAGLVSNPNGGSSTLVYAQRNFESLGFGQQALSDTPAISATGTTQATATGLTTDINSVTTVASGTGVFIRPWAATAGIAAPQQVFNAGANALLVYPPVSGASIWANGTTNTAGAAVSLAVGAHATFICESATLCRQAP